MVLGFAGVRILGSLISILCLQPFKVSVMQKPSKSRQIKDTGYKDWNRTDGVVNDGSVGSRGY